jgi:hypothetical protein
LRFENASERRRWQQLVEQTIHAYSFPSTKAGGGPNGGSSGFTVDTIKELERFSDVTTRIPSRGPSTSNQALFYKMIDPAAAHRAVIRRTVEIYQQLAGRDLVTTSAYAQGYYSFLRSFLQSPALRAFLFVCDWREIGPETVKEFVQSMPLGEQKRNKGGASAAPLGTFVDWLSQRFEQLFQPVAGASGSWWRVMFKLFLDHGEGGRR